ncbi:MAG TPA: hypothetical protein VK688_04530, partial [Gemmatimonadales bacterium]|nr:hypothetical protein [Gemmatimonadales bacterium]
MGSGSRYVPTLAVLAIGVFASLALYMRAIERGVRARAGVSEQLTAAGRVRPLADVTRAIQEMKLVTVEVDSKVTA